MVLKAAHLKKCQTAIGYGEKNERSKSELNYPFVKITA